MTNRERYKKAASRIEPSIEFTSADIMEASIMKKGTRRSFRRSFTTVLAVFVLIIGATMACYATDIGGFRQTVDTWLFGKKVEVQIEKTGEHEYTVTYPDGTKRGTGGLAFDNDGTERDLTPEEVIENLNNTPEIERNDEGRIIFYYRDHVIDITDKFDDDGNAKLKIKDGVLPIYISINWRSDDSYGVGTSPFGYPKLD